MYYELKSKAMKDKLAEEILEKNISMRGLIDFGNYSCVGIPYEDALKAMQAYHEAANKQVTDEDIELYPRRNSLSEATKHGIIEGAKAFRDGKIKHKENGNI